jgi:hypothetical protein
MLRLAVRERLRPSEFPEVMQVAVPSFKVLGIVHRRVPLWVAASLAD